LQLWSGGVRLIRAARQILLIVPDTTGASCDLLTMGAGQQRASSPHPLPARARAASRTIAADRDMLTASGTSVA